MKIFRPIWAEIDCDRVESNFRLIKQKVTEDIKINGVVKADAYGHGAVAVGRSLIHAGADGLCVASLEEACELRSAGIESPILILGYTQPGWASYVVEGGFTQTVYHLALARALSAEAVRQRKTVPVHIKIDSGMGRVGVQPERAADLIRDIAALDGIVVDGVFTHFSCADSDDDYTAWQIQRFGQLIGELETRGVRPRHIHASNSAAILKHKSAGFDMVRPGILLYGLCPSPALADDAADFRPAMTIKSTIVEIKTIAAGEKVSYGGTFRADRQTRIATIPAGYADGFSRKLSNRGRVLINGYYAPVAGNVCMDFMMIDVTDVPGVRIGDDVVLVGRQGACEISIDEIAAIMDTINYEAVSLIGKRVHRVFVNYLAGNPNEI